MSIKTPRYVYKKQCKLNNIKSVAAVCVSQKQLFWKICKTKKYPCWNPAMKSVVFSWFQKEEKLTNSLKLT